MHSVCVQVHCMNALVHARLCAYISLCVDKSVDTGEYIMFILIIFWPIGGGRGLSGRVLGIGLGNG